MKYLKLFNESLNEYWEEVTGREYNQVFSKYYDFPESKILISNTDMSLLLKSINKGYKIEFGNFCDDVNYTKDTIFYINDSSFFPSKSNTIGFQIRRNKWYDRTELILTGFIISDEYYYIREYKTDKVYRCDQVDGVVEFLKTKGISK